MEDFNSMGATSALKLLRVVEQAYQIVAIESICAAQMLDFRLPLKPGRGARRAYDITRSQVARLEHDRSMASDIERLARALKDGVFDELA
jgi:histidine ammonia-lyase